MNRREKIAFLKQFQQFGIIDKTAALPEVRMWVCLGGRWNLQGAGRSLSEMEMAGYMAKEGRLFANILVYADYGPPLASCEADIDVNPYSGPYYTQNLLHEKF